MCTNPEHMSYRGCDNGAGWGNSGIQHSGSDMGVSTLFVYWHFIVRSFLLNGTALGVNPVSGPVPCLGPSPVFGWLGVQNTGRVVLERIKFPSVGCPDFGFDRWSMNQLSSRQRHKQTCFQQTVDSFFTRKFRNAYSSRYEQIIHYHIND